MFKKFMVVLLCLIMIPLCSAASTNLFTNPGFESGRFGSLTGWGNPFTSNITWNSTAAHVHSGSNSLRFSTQTSNLPYAAQTLSNICEGATYSYGMYVKTENAGCNIAFKFEWKDANGQTLLQSGSDSVTTATNGSWAYLSGTEVAPEGARTVGILLRMYGTGTAYVDDVSFQYERDPSKFLVFETDDIFYYSDRTEDGHVEVQLNMSFHKLGNTVVKMEFQKDGETKYAKESMSDESGKVTFDFPLAWIEEKATKYTILCSVEDESVSQNVYIFDRPNYIRKDGVYEENGKVFDPVPIYHVSETDTLDTLQSAGINVVQIGANTTWLSELESRNMKALAVLYDGNTSAGAASRLETTKNIVRNYRKREGIFAWAVQDEPDIKPQTLQELEAAYVTIRQYDANHPVWITANGDFETLAKYCDVLCTDAYPYSNSLFTTRTAESVTNAVRAAKGKPVYSLLQAFAYKDSEPNADQLRNMLYQSFLAGAKGVGYYCYLDAIGTLDLPETDLWPAVQAFGKEKEIAFRTFVHMQGEVLLKGEDEKATWLVKAMDGDVFLLVLNKSYANSLEKTISHTAFTSDMQTISADGTKAENVTMADGSVTVTLQKNEALFVRLASAATTIRFVSDAGEALSTLSPGDKVCPYACVWKKDAENYSLIFAVYDKNQLVGLSVYSGQAQVAAPSFTLGEVKEVQAGLRYRLMLWRKGNFAPIENIEFTT